MNEVFVPHLGRLTNANPPQRHEMKCEEGLVGSVQITLFLFLWVFPGFCAFMNVGKALDYTFFCSCARSSDCDVCV